MLERFLAVFAKELVVDLAPRVLNQEAELGVLDEPGVLPFEDFVELLDQLGLIHGDVQFLLMGRSEAFVRVR